MFLVGDGFPAFLGREHYELNAVDERGDVK
jgi:hypothetical protein